MRGLRQRASVFILTVPHLQPDGSLSPGSERAHERPRPRRAVQPLTRAPFSKGRPHTPPPQPLTPNPCTRTPSRAALLGRKRPSTVEGEKSLHALVSSRRDLGIDPPQDATAYLHRQNTNDGARSPVPSARSRSPASRSRRPPASPSRPQGPPPGPSNGPLYPSRVLTGEQNVRPQHSPPGGASEHLLSARARLTHREEEPEGAERGRRLAPAGPEEPKSAPGRPSPSHLRRPLAAHRSPGVLEHASEAASEAHRPLGSAA